MSYVVLGSITTVAGTVSTTKKDMTIALEDRLATNIEVTYSDYWYTTTHEMDFRIRNAGNTPIDYTKLNFVITTQDSPPPTIYIDSAGSGVIGSDRVGTWEYEGIYRDESWNAEIINPGQWDPGEFVYGWISLNPHPVEFHAFTPNGATSYRPAT